MRAISPATSASAARAWLTASDASETWCPTCSKTEERSGSRPSSERMRRLRSSAPSAASPAEPMRTAPPEVTRAPSRVTYMTPGMAGALKASSRESTTYTLPRTDATAAAKPSRTFKRSTRRKPAASSTEATAAASHERSKASPEASCCPTAKEPRRASACPSIVTKASISKDKRLSTRDSRSSGASMRSPKRAAISSA